MKKLDEIQDDELRVIGRSSGPKPKSNRLLIVCAAVVAVVCVAVIAVLSGRKREPVGKEKDFYDKSTAVEEILKTAPGKLDTIGDYSDTVTVYTEHLQRTVNDIILDIYIPHNAVPELHLGALDTLDTGIILAGQAADIRADNGKINGAFVLAGKPLSWGLSKKGYVSIIDGRVSVGVSDNSPLFEDATENGGYFFRQYPLVANGVMIDNEPKGKSIRKSICERKGEIMLVFSSTPESFHDFAQALADFGVDNAVYLVGGNSHGYYRDETGAFHPFSDQWNPVRRQYENHIQWVRK